LSGRKRVAEEDLQDALRVGLDCLPEVRRKLLLAAVAEQGLKSVDMPWTTGQRAYEDLRELKVLDGSRDSLKLTGNIQSLLTKAKLVLPNCSGWVS